MAALGEKVGRQIGHGQQHRGGHQAFGHAEASIMVGLFWFLEALLHDELSLVVLAICPAVVAEGDIVTDANREIFAEICIELIAHVGGYNELSVIGV